MSVSSSFDSSSRTRDDQALDWFVRRRRGLSPAEETEFRAWLNADAAHDVALARWEDDWDGLDALPADDIAVLKRELATQKRAAEHEDRGQGFWSKLLAVPAYWIRQCRQAPRSAWAAALLVLVVLGSLGWYGWPRPIYEHSFVTARGEQRSVDLPDGSQLQLDTATRVEVIFTRDRRELRLPEGQAFFRVAHDPAHPFDVLAGALRVTVLGTRFSVRHTPDVPGNDGVRVGVEEGRVWVGPAGQRPVAGPLRASGDGTSVVLTAGQQVVSDAAGRLSAIAAIPKDRVAAWRDGRVSFDNTPLAQALAEFERYGATHLAIADPAVAALGVTGTFDPRHIGNFVRILPEVLPVRLRQHGDVMEIVAAR